MKSNMAKDVFRHQSPQDESSRFVSAVLLYFEQRYDIAFLSPRDPFCWPFHVHIDWDQCGALWSSRNSPGYNCSLRKRECWVFRVCYADEIFIHFSWRWLKSHFLWLLHQYMSHYAEQALCHSLADSVICRNMKVRSRSLRFTKSSA